MRDLLTALVVVGVVLVGLAIAVAMLLPATPATGATMGGLGGNGISCLLLAWVLR